MKIAICLSGKFSGKNDRGDIQGFHKSYEYLKKNIIDDNDVDVFIHGWDDDEKTSKELIETIQPKNYLLEKQKEFKHPFSSYNFTPSGNGIHKMEYEITIQDSTPYRKVLG